MHYLQIISSSFPVSKARKEDVSISQAGAPHSMLQGCLSWWDLLPSPGARGDPSLYSGCISWARLAQLLSEWFTGQPRSRTALSATGTFTGEMLRKHKTLLNQLLCCRNQTHTSKSGFPKLKPTCPVRTSVHFPLLSQCGKAKYPVSVKLNPSHVYTANDWLHHP